LNYCLLCDRDFAFDPWGGIPDMLKEHGVEVYCGKMKLEEYSKYE